jgi:hypothetical protein
VLGENLDAWAREGKRGIDPTVGYTLSAEGQKMDSMGAASAKTKIDPMGRNYSPSLLQQKFWYPGKVTWIPKFLVDRVWGPKFRPTSHTVTPVHERSQLKDRWMIIGASMSLATKY